MGNRYILTIDQSTSATKAVLFDQQGRVKHRVGIEHAQFYPQPGWAEHDANEILRNTRSAAQRVVSESGVPRSAIACMGITNQRETIVAWDGRSGEPIYRAIVWQDERGTPYCRQLEEEGAESLVRERTGLLLDTYFSATKLQWIVEQCEPARQVYESGWLMCGTIDSWLIWNLTDRAQFATDHSNACRTLLLNIRTLSWDPELASLFGLSRARFPDLKQSSGDYGVADLGDGLRLPILSVMGDSHAALFGQAAFAPGQAKTTYGTGSSIMMNAGSNVPLPPKGIVVSVGWTTDEAATYVLEGNIHYTGDTVRWVRENLGLFGDMSEAEKLAASLADNGGVYLVPAFSGLGAPHWAHGIRACITGLSRGSGRAEIIRAAFESIAYQVRDVIEAMAQHGHESVPVRDLRVDGGATRNSFLMQFQADMLDAPIHVASVEEVSARGVAFMSGLRAGIWKDTAELSSLAVPARTFTPSIDPEVRNMLLRGWNHAIAQALV